MSSRPLFTAFGIPVTFDPFFLFAAFLLYSLAGGGRRGIYTVVAVLVFVVVHEFGHALTAKAFGATAAITVTFLAGFASYTAPKRLTTWQSNLISLAGPAVEIALAIPLLVVSQRLFAGATTADQQQSAFEMYQAIAWAGILLGITNLAPLWPLDGGHVVERILVGRFGERAQRPFAIWSVAASTGLLVVSVFASRLPYVDHAMATMSDGIRRSGPEAVWATVQAAPAFLLEALFIPLFCLLGAGMRLAQLNASHRGVTAQNVPTGREMAYSDAIAATRQAERASWAAAALAPFPSGWTPSPWVRAHVDMVGGRQPAAVADLADLADDRPRHWLLDRVDRPEIGHLLTLVPPSAADSLAVLEARVHHGTPEDLVALATHVFLEEQSAEPLYLGAAGLAVRGLNDEAMQWLRRAVNVAPDPHRIAIDREFHGLHHRSDFQQLLGEAQRSAGVNVR